MPVNYSGLYKVTANATADTLYDRTVSPVATTALEIPNPYAKTAFVTQPTKKKKRRRKL